MNTSSSTRLHHLSPPRVRLIGLGLFVGVSALLFANQDAGFTRDESFYFSYAEGYQEWFRDIAHAVSQAMDVPVTFADGAGPDTRDYRVDFTKIGRVLPGFVPAWTIRDGIAELSADMAERGLAAEDFEGPRFVRLARIRELQAAGRMTPDLRLDQRVEVAAS